MVNKDQVKGVAKQVKGSVNGRRRRPVTAGPRLKALPRRLSAGSETYGDVKENIKKSL